MGLFISPSPLHPLLVSRMECVHHPKWIANYEAFYQKNYASDGELASFKSSPKSPNFAQVGYHVVGYVHISKLYTTFCFTCEKTLSKM
jgi:hypothetical protein